MEIISFKYFIESESDNWSEDWNAKVVYKKNSKVYHCCLYIDSFYKDILFPKKQPKECKVLSGIKEATKLYLKY